MLSIQKLSVGYGQDLVIKDLTWELAENQLHGLVGLNGSGKTTLLATLCRRLKPTKGTICWKNKEILPKDLAFLETEPFFYPYITGKEYLQIFRSQNRNFDIMAWNEIFDLPLNHLIETYSTGMKKKLALLALLSLDRPCYLLDEPSNGLDLAANQLLRQVFIRLKEKNKTVIITSHIFEELLAICDQIHHLHQGQISKTYGKEDFGQLASDLLDNLQTERQEHLNRLL